jgi:L-threonylcarbamoyladenylate synthase
MLLPDSTEARDRAARVVEAGGVVAFRTDTFYGLGADPFNREALLQIKKIKGREDGKPILVLVSERENVDRFFSELPPQFEIVAEHFWPGALTIVARAQEQLPDELTAGTGTIGVRLPDDEDVRAFVRACGGALTATSANRSGMPPARSAQEVEVYFGKEIDLILDSGPARSEEPSTVLDISQGKPAIIREGVVKREELERILEF